MEIAFLLDNFDLLMDSPNSTAKLRELILQLAVQGKLVPQNSADEPASVLLEKIAKEKDRLIKEGNAKIKKQKPLPKISEDEKPFELPEGWEWARLGNFVSIQTGKKDVNEGNENGIYPFFSCAAISLKSDNYSFDCEALLLPGNGANVGLVTYYNGKFEAYQRTYVLNDFIEIFPKYVEKSLNARFLKSIEGKQYGSAINYIKIGNLLDFIFSLPPLAEQQRIVAKVDELMALCDQLEQQQTDSNTAHQTLVEALLATLTTTADQGEFAEAWHRIASHFDALFTTEQSIDKLKQAILQLAVMGKLVPQDPNDEPASELLKHIKAEKEKLIAEGKIKKQKPFPSITKDEIRYELPQGWSWERLGNIGQINPRNYVKDDEIDVSFVPMKMISEKYGKHHSFEKRKWSEVKNGFTHFMENDVGLAKITPCFENGKSTIFKGLLNGVGAGTTELHIFRQDPELVLPEYVLIFFKSSKFLNDAKEKMTGTAGQKRVPRDFVMFVPFPIPPISEQKRIVAKVDQLILLCEELESNLTRTQKDSEELMQAALQEAFERNNNPNSK